MKPEVIATEHLLKHYKDVIAVNDLSLNVNRGEIYGFLGLNGAGKTTTIRMLLGMIRPDSGAVYLFGKKVGPDCSELWSKTGYLVEVPYAYPNLTVRENLEMMRQLRLLPHKSSVDRVIDLLKLGNYANRKTKNLSLGNAQRLGLAKALIHQPEILILDEPANGLDPEGIHEIRELFTDLALNQGVTVFISSHILGEISKFATRIGIIHEGKLVQEVNTSELELLCRKELHIRTGNNKDAVALLSRKNLKVWETEDQKIICESQEAINRPEEIAAMLVRADNPPSLIKVEEEDLESYFLRIINLRKS
jgi:ABC-2 type transport system ATP-binding protein